MERESYIKRLVTSYKNLNETEKEMFRSELNLCIKGTSKTKLTNVK